MVVGARCLCYNQSAPGERLRILNAAFLFF